MTKVYRKLKKMKNSISFIIGLLIAGTLAVIGLTDHIKAGFEPEDYNVHVEVGDIQFGAFDEIVGIDEITTKDSAHKYVVLKRNFVTDPSFYLWARDVAEEHKGPKNIELVYKNAQGQEVSRVTLKASQPLAWTVEAADPSLGGFHERIELAVQKVIKQ